MDTIVLYRGKHIKLTKIDGTIPVAIVTFNAFTETKNPVTPNERFEPGFAEGLFYGDGFYEYHIVTNRNDWFQDSEMDVAIEAIKHDFPGDKIITYGSSMGAFGAINFSLKLNSDFVALAPQFSINPGDVEGDVRWRYENSAIDFRYNYIKSNECLNSKGYVFFDSLCPDNVHAKLIEEHTHAILIDIRFGDHLIGDILNDCYGIKRVVEEIALSKFELNKFYSEYNKNKETESSYHIKAANYYCRNRNIAEAQKHMNCVKVTDRVYRNEGLLYKYFDTLVLLGKIQSAYKLIESYKTYLQSVDKNISEFSYRYFAEFFMENSDYSDAKKVLSHALSLYKDNDKLYYLNSVTLYNLTPEDLTESISSVRRAIEIYKNPEYYYYLGELLFLNGNHEESRYAYLTAINLNGSIYYYYSRLSCLYWKLEKIDPAISAIKKSISLNSKISNSYYLLGEYLYSKKDFLGSYEAYDEAIKLEPNPPDYYFYNFNKLKKNKIIVFIHYIKNRKYKIKTTL